MISRRVARNYPIPLQQTSIYEIEINVKKTFSFNVLVTYIIKSVIIYDISNPNYLKI